MIKTELRIGNLIYIPSTGQILPVTAISMDLGLWVNRSLGVLGFDQIEPIPLSEEWMLKCGFQKSKSENLMFLPLPKQGIEIHYEKHNYGSLIVIKSEFGVVIPNDIDSVHQLQNLVFALGEELTINN